MKALDGQMLVAGQIGPDDMRAIAAAGVTLVVNNRPDNEERGQPESATIEAAANQAGLDYRHIPVAGTISPDEIEAMTDALERADGKVLAFCRSGTRSTYLWALARSRRGANGKDLIAKAAAAGYDLSPLLPHLR